MDIPFTSQARLQRPLSSLLCIFPIRKPLLSKTNTKIIEEKANEVTEKSSKNEITETKNEQKRRGGAVSLELIGEENVEVDKGSKYKDPGVKATYSDGTDASNEVDVDNAVDTSKEGTYTVSYYAGNAVVIRRVTVK